MGANEGYSCVVLIRNFLSNAIALVKRPQLIIFYQPILPRVQMRLTTLKYAIV